MKALLLQTDRESPEDFFTHSQESLGSSGPLVWKYPALLIKCRIQGLEGTCRGNITCPLPPRGQDANHPWQCPYMQPCSQVSPTWGKMWSTSSAKYHASLQQMKLPILEEFFLVWVAVDFKTNTPPYSPTTRTIKMLGLFVICRIKL